MQEGTQTISGSLTDSTGTLSIGRVGVYNADYFNGFVSNFNLIKGTAKYPDGTTFSIPTSKTTAHANTKLLICQSKKFVDNSTNQYRVKPNNEPIVSEFHPFDDGYWSAEFDGTDDNITIPNSNSNTNIGYTEIYP